MKRFIINISIFLLAGFVSVNIFMGYFIKNEPEKYLGNMAEYHMWRKQSSTIDSLKNKIINIIIGDSRGMSAVMPTLMSDNYINLSLAGATVFEGYHTLKRLLENGNKLDTLILCYAQYHYEEHTELEKRSIPFAFINHQDLMELERLEMETGYQIDGIGERKTKLKDMISRHAGLVRFPISYRSTFLYNFKNNNHTRSIDEMLSTMNSQRGYTQFGKADSTHQAAKEAKRLVFSPNPVLKIYLDSVIHIAEREKIKVFITVPPVSEITYKNCSPRYLQQFNDFLDTIQKSNPCTILNHTIVYPNMYFGDASHLNTKGAIKFTNDLKKNIAPKQATQPLAQVDF